MVLGSTFLVSHAELFGLRQVSLYARGQQATSVGFKTPSLYKLVRHPIYLGFITGFLGYATNDAGHLLSRRPHDGVDLASHLLEERDLISFFGDAYRDYKRRVPMLSTFHQEIAVGPRFILRKSAAFVW